MQSNDLSAAVNQDEEIAACYLPHISGGVLDGHGVGTGHEGARDWQVRQQLGGPGQHGFAFMLEIFESIYRVAQVNDDALADIALDAPPHQKQAGGGETR